MVGCSNPASEDYSDVQTVEPTPTNGGNGNPSNSGGNGPTTNPNNPSTPTNGGNGGNNPEGTTTNPQDTNNGSEGGNTVNSRTINLYDTNGTLLVSESTTNLIDAISKLPESVKNYRNSTRIVNEAKSTTFSHDNNDTKYIRNSSNEPINRKTIVKVRRTYQSSFYYRDYDNGNNQVTDVNIKNTPDQVLNLTIGYNDSDVNDVYTLSDTPNKYFINEQPTLPEVARLMTFEEYISEQNLSENNGTLTGHISWNTCHFDNGTQRLKISTDYQYQIYTDTFAGNILYPYYEYTWVLLQIN